MKKIALQILGIIVLIPAVGMATLRVENQNADGPSILFPGGEMTTGRLHTGPEPDWSFTDDIQLVELQLNDPMASRLIYVLEADGRLFIISGYMTTMLGRLWKEWAFEADEGNNGVAAKLITKYGGAPNASPEAIARTRAGIEAGNSWVFELIPR